LKRTTKVTERQRKNKNSSRRTTKNQQHTFKGPRIALRSQEGKGKQETKNANDGRDMLLMKKHRDDHSKK